MGEIKGKSAGNLGEERGSAGEIFLTAKDVAKRYGCSKQWPYHSPEIRKLATRIGKKMLRWKLSRLEAFEAGDTERAEVLRQFKRWEDKNRESRVKFTM